MEELINKLKEFKASEGDKAAEEMEETIKEAIVYLERISTYETECRKKSTNNLDYIIVNDIYGNEARIDIHKIIDEHFESVRTIVKFLGNQQEQLQEKDKIIDEMIKVIIDSSICDYFIKQNCKHYAGENRKTCDSCIIEYFTKKARKV